VCAVLDHLGEEEARVEALAHQASVGIGEGHDHGLDRALLDALGELAARQHSLGFGHGRLLDRRAILPIRGTRSTATRDSRSADAPPAVAQPTALMAPYCCRRRRSRPTGASWRDPRARRCGNAA